VVNDSTFDVVIAGGGPVGWACALAASSALGKLARVAVIDRDPHPAATSAPSAALSARVYTLATGNLNWLTEQGVSFAAERSAAVTDIVVCGRDGRESLRVSAADAGQTQLATVVEHEALAHAIAERARQRGVHTIAGVCSALHNGAALKMVELTDQRLLQARVVIAADGMNSTLRQLEGVQATVRAYPQSGVVAHLRCVLPHQSTARQWFLADGSILALLPLPNVEQKTDVSMVWSAKTARADVLCSMTHAELLGEINAVTQPAAVAVELLSAAQPFPLTLVRVANPVSERFVVVGDAAHAVHPLAGQGVNLGLVDARVLHEVWQQVGRVNADPGHPLLLARYRRERYGPTLAMQLATDGLFRLYNQVEHPILMAAGDAGMRLLGRLPAFRRTLSTNALQ
jgi:2-polyprenylphenol 6-hydroxylase